MDKSPLRPWVSIPMTKPYSVSMLRFMLIFILGTFGQTALVSAAVDSESYSPVADVRAVVQSRFGAIHRAYASAHPFGVG